MLEPDIWRCAAANLDWYAILVAAETFAMLVAIGVVRGRLLRLIREQQKQFSELRKRIETMEEQR